MTSEDIIGFRRELEHLEDWITEAPGESQLWSVSGIGGIGKTTLLLELARRARSSDLTVLWLDGRSAISSPLAWLTALETGLAMEYGRQRTAEKPLLPYIMEELRSRQTVVLVDDSESIASIEGWLTARFLPELTSAHVLLVFASRSGLPLRWHTVAYWGARLKRWELELLTRAEVHQYLQTSGLQPALQMAIAQQNEGLPLLLAMTVDLLRDQATHDGLQLPTIPTLLTGEYLREAASPELYQALLALALLPAADQEMLNDVLDRPLTAVDYHALGELSFIRVTPYGLSLHRVVARIVREDWLARHNREFQQRRQAAFRQLARQYSTADGAYRALIAAHTLELFREFLPTSHIYVNFASPLHAKELSPFRPGDLPTLLRLLRTSVARSDWQSELASAASYDALLSDIAAHAPEGLFILRDDQGQPLAFCAGFWLHQEGLRALERFAAPLARLLDQESGSRPTPEQADTICLLLAAVDVEQSYYTPEELGAWLMQQWLVEMTRGFRCLVVTADTTMGQLLSAFGFEMRASEAAADASTGGIGYQQWELDLRQDAFPAWVERVMQQTAATMRDEPAVAAAAEPGQECLLTWQEAKQLLTALYDPEALAELPAFRQLRVSASELQHCVDSILTADALPYPLTPSEQQILRASYLHRDRNKSQLADGFHMSRASFYRHSKTALQHFAQALRRALSDRR